MMDRLSPQLRKIVNHCSRVGYITGRAAIMDYGIMSLPRRIADLKDLGFQVRVESRSNPSTGQRYVRYFVTQPEVLAA